MDVIQQFTGKSTATATATAQEIKRV